MSSSSASTSSARTVSLQARSPPAENSKTKDVSGSGSKPKPPPNHPTRGGGYKRRGETQQQQYNPNNRRGGRQQPRRGGYQPPRRDGYQQQPAAARRSAVTEADEFEVGSIFNAGTKKQSLNHLLNFQYTPRGEQRLNGDRRTGHPPSRRKGGHQEQAVMPRFTKEQYLQSHCQFVVSPFGDYSLHQVDPDMACSWELIEEVHLKTVGGTEEAHSCPICLFPPTAGKISKCGHVFCWACILHYLALSDDDWRKCPICYDNISKGDLKSVKIIQQENHVTGSKMEMRLMKRERHSLVSVPVNHPGLQGLPSLSHPDRSLSKLIKGSPEEIRQHILDRERGELERQYREERDQPEVVFVQQALTLLQAREDQWALAESALPSSPLDPPAKQLPKAASAEAAALVVEEVAAPKAEQLVDPFESLEDALNQLDLENQAEEETVKMSAEPIILSPAEERPRHISSSGSDVSSDGDEITAADLDISGLHPESRNTPKSTFYFYQDAQGQYIFLHALNIQMLVHEYGALENCPPIISGKILEKDTSTMTEQLRDRLRYLRHLPVSSTFEVAEMDMEGLLSPATLKAFKDQLENRKRKRQRKMKAEKVREKRIHRDNMRLMGRYPSPMARIESEYHYPRMVEESGAHGIQEASASDNSGQFPSMGGGAAAETSPPGAGNGGSWAKLAKNSTARAPAPQPKPQPTTNTNGMVQLGGALPMSRVRKASDSEPEPEGYVPPPPAASLGDALAQALAQADKQATTTNNKKKGKKSRGKGILLSGGPQRPIL